MTTQSDPNVQSIYCIIFGYSAKITILDPVHLNTDLVNVNTDPVNLNTDPVNLNQEPINFNPHLVNLTFDPVNPKIIQ